MSTPHLTFADVDRIVEARQGETVYETARRGGVRIVGACGGRGTCGTCMVRVGASRKWERACRAHPHRDTTVTIAPRSLAPVVRAESKGEDEILPLDAAVEAHIYMGNAPTLKHPIADDDNVANGLKLSPHSARALTETMRANDWKAEFRIRGDQLIDVAEPGRKLLGLGVDLGTTNVAAFLIDFRSGSRLAGFGIENPQVGWGADVIARINAAVRDKQAEHDLTSIIRQTLSVMAHDLTLAVGASPRDIVDVVICGNTAMHHLLLGLPVYQLGRAPFVASIRDELTVPARDLGLDICPDAEVHAVANVGGFVGGDHVTSLLATEHLWSRPGLSLIMDIGTNTEISVIENGRILSASSPSGPALEGGNISCGMRAAEGAIEAVRAEAGRLTIATISDKEPIGLCGSGVLDALAAAHDAGIINAGGRISPKHPDVVRSEDGKPLIQLAEDVTLSQHDIRAIQLAKSAIRTAAQMLLQEAGRSEADIARFVIAGAFGAHVSVPAGIASGLFPDISLERYHQIGNAAGRGVREMVASKKARKRATEIAAKAEYVELSARPGFQSAFLSNLNLPGEKIALRSAS